MSKKAKYTDFWHIRHSCGHAVYWSDIDIAGRVSKAPCPWCGAEDGNKLPQSVPVLHDPKAGVLAFRELLPDGRVPWPSELADSGGRVALRHRADNGCCGST
ncbi:hypothetical protein SAMN02746095_02239 [Acidocella aminolytica 101 = DSM 11237]|uniref:Uncharacterized protein n=1 Tax=Acidocella aminolytica 101 = DSM 11237 TaxID=1120923 RepID=A0A0D6PM44_9PROT|nr:hypothetical protein [Acidocella aminolytica]GAN81869.1 hypothetical protein Aam_125_011 [Acidocella aminolytica 101 = DSM 11237]GBQ39965.1 hypothetical protein AA11237_2228 [Acidocella aminolytica 101 = DSM 11237]SHF14266.1 hypothetical protein SAMN02746095_02239 [Acidocella aminolytica 101 = DSM 11237]